MNEMWYMKIKTAISNNNKTFALVALLLITTNIYSWKLASPNDSDKNQTLAFPGAEGFGKFTTGGRGGKVLIVDNLNDSGPGSLREAIKGDFPRTIVFNVSGTIALESALKVRHGDVTIAGQTAPGDGICLKNYSFSVNSDNVIIRYLRVRMGDEERQQDDSFSAIRQKNIILDHCSFSWGTDEVATAYDNENFTMQWCIISESLNNSVHEKGEHGYGGIWGGKGASFHHNLMAHHKSRLPRFCGARYHKEPEKEVVDFRNNVIYNWKSNNSYAGEEGNHNIVNNYYKPGPSTSKSKRSQILNPWSPYGSFFLKGNILYGNDEVTSENSKGVYADHPDSCLVGQSIKVVEINTQSAREAYENVLKSAGASLARDPHDQRIVDDVKNGSAGYGVKKDGIIDSQKMVDGWPELKTYNVRPDGDRDGLPDDWEKKNGLDPSDGADHALYSLDKAYTNLEIYLNELVSKK
jgi:hypothetical protein